MVKFITRIKHGSIKTSLASDHIKDLCVSARQECPECDVLIRGLTRPPLISQIFMYVSGLFQTRKFNMRILGFLRFE